MAKILTFRRKRPWAKRRRGHFSYYLHRWLGLTIVIAFFSVHFAQQYGLPDFGLSTRPAPSALKGRASVIDGDTIEIHGQRIRFNGIDAPETDQLCTNEKGKRYRCGAEAAEFLRLFLERSQPARCDFVDWDQYGRFVGNCFRADGLSVAAALVRGGHALDWPKYSGGVYAGYQDEAKADRLGLWRGEFELPWDYRARTRANSEQKAEPQSLSGNVRNLLPNTSRIACNIKGNISLNSGERIYHVPGQEYYSRTRIQTEKGERWFCSEKEARAAGWRKARR